MDIHGHCRPDNGHEEDCACMDCVTRDQQVNDELSEYNH